MQQLIVIQGPTASGKTALAIALAKKLNTVVINADSRQFYKELSIGTAKPSKEEMDGVPHYFIDSHSIHDALTAGEFEKQALALIQELNQYKQLIVVGGSGMFIDALCKGLDPLPVDKKIQQEFQKELEEKGLESLLDELKSKDLSYFNQVDRQNPARVLRALEVMRISHRPFSELRSENAQKRPFESFYFTIDIPRALLYERINQRVDLMIDTGLEKEVRLVYPFKEIRSLQTVGYNEFFDYFDGKIDYSTCIEKIKQHTRNYAKRQYTWFKRNPYNTYIPFGTTQEMCQFVFSSF